MANKVGIGIEAQFDARDVERQINALGQKIAQANKVQFTPFSRTTQTDIEKIVKQFEQLRKIHSELNRRMKDTGQSGANLFNLDWDKLYVDPATRSRQMRRVFEYVTGSQFGPQSGGGGGGSGGGGGGGGLGGMAAQVAQAGLRATGPVGGVAANAIGTGMSSGFGAGLMGMLGGMLALGVGKLIGSVMERVEQAENNNVALDRLKRSIGDVNVSFEGLKSVVNSGADNLRITYAEAGQLAQQFAKLSNLPGSKYGQLFDELNTGVGLSRSFGLDPSQGVDVLGRMRGLGVTSSTQESRRFALLIGETIGKSGAFAKADEVMEALSNYMTSQTRAGLGGANQNAYAGLFAAMVGSGVKGMDPTNAAAILGRMNSALTGGGAKGEASQFFSAMVADRMGLNPLQAQLWREAGMFAKPNEVFGKGSVYARYTGKTRSLAGGDMDFYSATRKMIEEKYAGNTEEQKLLRANAFANHTGLSMTHAMLMMTMDPKKMGELAKFGDLSKFNAAGIEGLAKAQFGSAADRQDVATSLLGREDISRGEKDDIKKAMKGSESLQRETLSKIIAQHDQERDTGKDVRDSKNALDNIKTNIADKLVPYFNEARLGIMYLAGGKDKKTTDDIVKEVIKNDSEGRIRAIKGQFTGEINDLMSRESLLDRKARTTMDPLVLRFTYRDNPKVLEEKMKERQKILDELSAIDKRLAAIKKEEADLIKKENERRERETAEVDEQTRRRLKIEAQANLDDSIPVGQAPDGAGGGYGSGGRRGGGRGSGNRGALEGNPAAMNEAMKYFMSKGWSKAQAAAIVSNLVAESGLNPDAKGDKDEKGNFTAFGIAQWRKSRLDDFAKWAGHDISKSTLKEQMDFVDYELRNGNYKNVGDKLKDEDSAGRGGALLSRNWEVPADAEGEASRRANFASKIFGELEVNVNVNTPDGKKSTTQSVPVRQPNHWRPGRGASGKW